MEWVQLGRKAQPHHSAGFAVGNHAFTTRMSKAAVLFDGSVEVRAGYDFVQQLMSRCCKCSTCATLIGFARHEKPAELVEESRQVHESSRHTVAAYTPTPPSGARTCRWDAAFAAADGADGVSACLTRLHRRLGTVLGRRTYERPCMDPVRSGAAVSPGSGSSFSGATRRT